MTRCRLARLNSPRINPATKAKMQEDMMKIMRTLRETG